MKPVEKSIAAVNAIEILDSRGNPTIKATVILKSGEKGSACVPSGASTGSFEAHELRDGQKRYHGRGVSRAVDNIEKKIAPAVCGMIVNELEAIDSVMKTADGSENKSRLGANAMLGVSMACARAAANSAGMELFEFLGGKNANILPVPMMNILNGGKHAGNNIDIQEFMIMPVGAESFSQALQWGSEIYHALGSILKSRGLSTAVGDEGGFAPDLAGDEEAIELLLTAIEATGLNTEQVKLALDAAATEWMSGEKGYAAPKRKTVYTAQQLCERWEKLCAAYPIFSLEDGMGENDWHGWRILTEKLGGAVQLVGDDLFVTNTQRIEQGIAQKAANAVLIKPNQIGTLTETLSAIRLTQLSGYKAVVSHRSGETEDAFIADLAVATNAGQIKAGAPCRGERVAKYNRLLEIERLLGSSARYGVAT